MIQPLNIIDLVTILPFYVTLGLGEQAAGFSALRVFRLLRIFRVFKVGKYSASFSLLTKTFTMSRDSLLLLIVLLSMLLILFGSILYYVEQFSSTLDPETLLWMTPDGDVSPFQNIPETFWFVIATMTTVGYGDVVPFNWPGKIVAGITMIAGIIIMALPVSIILSNFQQILQAHQNQEKINKQQKKAKGAGIEKYKLWESKKLIQKIDKIFWEMDSKVSSINGLANDISELHQQMGELVAVLNSQPEKI